MELILKPQQIEGRIFTLRGVQVMLDRDLAELYGVDTKVLNQAVKRNIERFPLLFRFQLSDEEKNELVTNCDRFKNMKHASVSPYAFTEQGVAMLSAVLRSETAIKVSVQIISAFVAMRKMLAGNALLTQRVDKIEIKQLETDQKIERVFKALENQSEPPREGIFFDGQVFDAYTFVADLIKNAKSDIVLIDNYVDESVLTLLSKRKPNVVATIYTKTVNNTLKLDLQKHNAQYPAIEIKTLADSHDRFLIIDRKELYHIGASLKDVGKKWFAFSKMDSLINELLNKLDPLSPE
ncbi:MAG: ORF6N domain-containing protein [Thermoguttaceae bacterium]